jgi:hypothetical protein
MTGRITPGDVRDALCPLCRSLDRIRASDDPVVTFARVARACVPEFADGCRAELTDGTEPPFRVTHRAGSAERPEAAAADPVRSEHVLLAPVRVVSRPGYPSYAGIMTFWWDAGVPSPSSAMVAQLIVRHTVALIDGERLRAEVARADDRAASLALNALSSRVITLATGIVMHQRRLSEDEAERVLRQAARDSGRAAADVAADILGSGALAEAAGAPVRLSAGAHDRDLPAGVRHIGTAQAARQLIS